MTEHKCPNCGVKLMLTQEASEEHFIPKSRIQQRIKELEDSPAPQWIGRWEILDAKMEELKDLLK